MRMVRTQVKQAHNLLTGNTGLTDLIIAGSALILMLASFLGLVEFWGNFVSVENINERMMLRKVSVLFFTIGIFSFGLFPKNRVPH